MTDNGFIVLARKITESEVFVFKPAVWIKLWMYFLARVNWKDTSTFKKGSGFFRFDIVASSFYEGELTLDIYRKALHFMREAKMISTSRTPRGLKISILNYGLYQNLDNYRSTTEAHQKHNRSTSITEEGNKETIKREGNTPPTYDKVWGKEIADKYFVFEEDVERLWERMVNSRLANGKPYKDWKRGLLGWLVPSIEEGKIKKTTETNPSLGGFDLSVFKEDA